jgi:hypothetical protein
MFQNLQLGAVVEIVVVIEEPLPFCITAKRFLVFFMILMLRPQDSNQRLHLSDHIVQIGPLLHITFLGKPKQQVDTRHVLIMSQRLVCRHGKTKLWYFKWAFYSLAPVVLALAGVSIVLLIILTAVASMS